MAGWSVAGWFVAGQIAAESVEPTPVPEPVETFHGGGMGGGWDWEHLKRVGRQGEDRRKREREDREEVRAELLAVIDPKPPTAPEPAEDDEEIALVMFLM